MPHFAESRFAESQTEPPTCMNDFTVLNKPVAVRHLSVFRLIHVLQEFEAYNQRNLAKLARGT